MNTYGYVGGNPLYYIDPYGQNLATAEAGAIGGTFVCGPICGLIGGVAGFGVGAWGTWEFWNWYNNEDASDNSGDEKPKQCDKDSGRGRPWTGEPNSTTDPNKGGDSRRFGKDGLPEVDYDAPHPDERYPGNAPHVHNWDRPSNSGPPTAKDRGPSLPYSPIP